MRETLFIVAHPDDAEVMLGHAVAGSQEAWALIATDGEASTVDLVGRGFCPRQKAT